ncbi:MAG: sulfite exporter TauE/SafE family protein [Bryobacteraceae bacterium]|nr:sulfite exporter TauE/SafE family protein [Bryobacteraceae bacterium]
MPIVLGFLVATLVGLTGMGGGVLMVPLLILGLGLPTAEAVGTSLLFITLSKFVAAPIYMMRKQVDYKVAALQLLGGAPGVIIGVWLLDRMNTKAMQPYVLALVGLTILVLAVLSLVKSFLPKPAETKDRRTLLPWITFPIGLEVGFSSAGAGALGALSLMYCTPLSVSTIVGTDLLFGTAVSALGGGLHFASGNVNPGLLTQLCLGGIAGAATGAWLGTRVPSRPLRTALTAVLVVLGGQLLWKGLEVIVR